MFENFERIYLSFSGGKDSGAMLNITLDYMRKNNINRKKTPIARGQHREKRMKNSKSAMINFMCILFTDQLAKFNPAFAIYS